jgi:hypothetical protein
MNSKADLVSRLVRLAEVLGEPATPLVWRLMPTEKLLELFADAEARADAKARADANAADSDIADVAKRNDYLWFSMGGTRN